MQPYVLPHRLPRPRPILQSMQRHSKQSLSAPIATFIVPLAKTHDSGGVICLFYTLIALPKFTISSMLTVQMNVILQSVLLVSLSNTVCRSFDFCSHFIPRSRGTDATRPCTASSQGKICPSSDVPERAIVRKEASDMKKMA